MTERFGAGPGDYYGGPSRGRGACWVSVVIGWLSALSASLTLSGLIGSLRGVTLPGLLENITQQGLNASLTLSSVLALLLPFVTDALGGARGDATGSRRP